MADVKAETRRRGKPSERTYPDKRRRASPKRKGDAADGSKLERGPIVLDKPDDGDLEDDRRRSLRRRIGRVRTTGP